MLRWLVLAMFTAMVSLSAGVSRINEVSEVSLVGRWDYVKTTQGVGGIIIEDDENIWIQPFFLFFEDGVAMQLAYGFSLGRLARAGMDSFYFDTYFMYNEDGWARLYNDYMQILFNHENGMIMVRQTSRWRSPQYVHHFARRPYPTFLPWELEHHERYSGCFE